jgi:phage regulator Rha-like protein
MTALSVFNGGSPPTMTSKEIADIAGVRHDNAMRICRDLLDKNVTPQIEESTFSHNGNIYPCYILNKRDSYILMARLSPEFTGILVDRWQELELASQKPLSPMEMVIWSAQRIMQIEAEQEFQAKQLESLSSKVNDIAATNDAVLLQSDMFSVMGYCTLVGISVTLSQASGWSRSLGTICKKLEIQRKEVVDPRFGKVYLYPRVVLHDFFVNKGLISI